MTRLGFSEWVVWVVLRSFWYAFESTWCQKMVGMFFSFTSHCIIVHMGLNNPNGESRVGGAAWAPGRCHSWCRHMAFDGVSFCLSSCICHNNFCAKDQHVDVDKHAFCLRRNFIIF